MNDLGFAASLEWPVFALVVVMLFRKPLAELIGRITKAKVAGNEFDFGPRLERAEGKSDQALTDSPGIARPVDAAEVGKQALESALADLVERDELDQPVANLVAPPPPPPLGANEAIPPDSAERPSTVFEQAELARYKHTADLASEAEENPSWVILRAWDELASTLITYAKVVLPDNPAVRTSSSSLPFLQQMMQEGHLSASYVAATRDVRRLRNAVAHGQHNPTSGEAIAYAQTVGKLVYVATIQTGLGIEKRSSLANEPTSAAP